MFKLIVDLVLVGVLLFNVWWSINSCVFERVCL